jgi:hypothetical protein
MYIINAILADASAERQKRAGPKADPCVTLAENLPKQRLHAAERGGRDGEVALPEILNAVVFYVDDV